MPRLKSACLSVALAMIAVFTVAVTVFADQPKVFENSQWQYSVKYPAEFLLKRLGGVTVFIAPMFDKKTGFAENINIAVEDLSEPIPSLESLFVKAKAKLTLGGKAVKVLEEKKDKLSGVDAYRIIYTSKQKKTNFKFLQTIAIYKNRVYVVTYTALQEQFDRSLNQANSMIKSLKFTN
jgi:eukaryotic-like serine/threonine-protein kinase